MQLLFSLPDFRRLWFIGFALSLVRWLEMLALALFAYNVTGSAFVVAMLTMLRLVPMALFGALVGAAAERMDRRRVLVMVVTMSTTVSFTLAVLASVDALAVWHLAVASFVNGFVWVSDIPVRRMLIGDVVGMDRMGSALALDTATNNGTRILGPVASGLLLSVVSIAGVFWFSVALLVPCIAIVARFGVSRQKPAPPPSSMIASIREGIDWVLRDGRLAGAFLVTVIFNIFGWPTYSMVPVIGTDHLALGPRGVGILASCDGIGGLVGALFFMRLAPAQWYGRIYTGAVAAFFVMMFAFAMAPVASLAGTALFLAGLFQAFFSVTQTALVYRSAPVAMRARLLGVLSVCIGTGPIGFLYLGFLAEKFSPQTATMLLAVQGLIVLALTRRYWWRSLQL